MSVACYIFQCMLTLPMFFVSDLQSLIQYYGFIRWGSLGLPVLGLIWLRWKERKVGPVNDTADTVRVRPKGLSACLTIPTSILIAFQC